MNEISSRELTSNAFTGSFVTTPIQKRKVPFYSNNNESTVNIKSTEYTSPFRENLIANQKYISSSQFEMSFNKNQAKSLKKEFHFEESFNIEKILKSVKYDKVNIEIDGEVS